MDVRCRGPTPPDGGTGDRHGVHHPRHDARALPRGSARESELLPGSADHRPRGHGQRARGLVETLDGGGHRTGGRLVHHGQRALRHRVPASARQEARFDPAKRLRRSTGVGRPPKDRTRGALQARRAHDRRSLRPRKHPDHRSGRSLRVRQQGCRRLLGREREPGRRAPATRGQANHRLRDAAGRPRGAEARALGPRLRFRVELGPALYARPRRRSKRSHHQPAQRAGHRQPSGRARSRRPRPDLPRRDGPADPSPVLGSTPGRGPGRVSLVLRALGLHAARGPRFWRACDHHRPSGVRALGHVARRLTKDRCTRAEA